MIVALVRRPTPPPAEPASPATVEELIVTGIALIPAALGPNILVVALTPGMPGMPVLLRWTLVPALVLLVVAWTWAVRRGYHRLTNRIWTGIWVGFACTAALDVFRLVSFSLGFLPGNLPRMFGVLILDRMALGPTPLSDFVGYLYHSTWVSVSFALTYTLIVGRTAWWGGLIWGLLIEVGMMTTPPMVVAMGSGYFGLALGKGILNPVFLGSLVPHVAYGIMLGVLLERYTAHSGSIFEMIADIFGSRRLAKTH